MLEKYKLMNRISIINKLAICLVSGVMLSSCTKDPNSPGYEYFPDMYRSASVEAYVDYNNAEVQSARLPVAGTIPFNSDGSKAWINFPYPYPEGVEGYEMAVNLKNPVPYSEAMMEEAADLYSKFCTHCHGDKGDGKGTIALNGKIEGIPDYAGNIKTLPEGKIYHSISYGKGVMGAHAPLLTKEERWKLVHYVRKFQDDNYPNVEGAAVADSANVEAAPVVEVVE